MAFASMLIFLAVGHFFVVYKYFQILIHHSIYYCQEMVKALSLGLPGDLGKTIFGLLVLAALFTLVRLLATIFRIYTFRRTLLKTTTQRHGDLYNLFEKLDLRDKVTIINQRKPVAFCFGVRNPKIYISIGIIGLMSKEELEVILRHEKYHLEHRDALTLLLATAVESLFRATANF